MMPSDENRNFQSFAGFRRGGSPQWVTTFMAVRTNFKGQHASAAVPEMSGYVEGEGVLSVSGREPA